MRSLKKLTTVLKPGKRDICLVFSVTVSLFLFFYIAGYPIINLDNSVKGRIFWTLHDKHLHRGDFIVFNFRGSRYFPKGAHFIKIVTCLPGENLTMNGRCFYCNGKFVGCAKKFDREGRPAPLFKYEGRIPEGKYFVMGTHPDSYDSRYWGFVDKKQVITRVKRIL